MLKNGRIIHADSVQQQDEKIEYQVGDAVYRIPKSLVERIEERSPDPLSERAVPIPPIAGPDGTTLEPAEVPRLAKADQNTLKIPKDLIQKVVHDDRVDTEVLVALEKSASAETTGGGYFVAGRFEFEHANRDRAREYFERALQFWPDQPVILAQYAALLLQLSRAPEAVSYSERAARLNPNSADSHVILGYSYYAANRLPEAVKAWETALQIRKDGGVKEALDRAKRELTAEANYTQHESGHFTLRYEGSAIDTELRDQILNVLERTFSDISAEMGITPYQSISVVLYTQRDFFDVTRAPSWTTAIYDGKLRIPIKDLDSVTPELTRVLRHELAHSFVNQASGGRCPQWLNEGVAQLMERKKLGYQGKKLSDLYKADSAMPLRTLESSFLQYDKEEATMVYDQSLAAAWYLKDIYGMSDIRRFLERLSEGFAPEEAMRQTLNLDYRRLEADLRDYLISRYGS